MLTPTFVRLTAVVIGLGLGTLGCAHYTLQVPEPNPAGQTWSGTHVAYVWGVLEPKIIAKECDVTQAMDTVRVKDHLGFDLVSIVTLGLVKPIVIEYTCSAGRSSVGPRINDL